MDQRCGLECVARFLVLHTLLGDLTELVIHGFEQPVGALPVPCRNAIEENGHVRRSRSVVARTHATPESIETATTIVPKTQLGKFFLQRIPADGALWSERPNLRRLEGGNTRRA